ncbi:TPA: hypothetical protein DEP34_01330 [Candidatus Uhrbacteria bacterium]|uniref:Uncharacterized protein n=2 Tax=Candidatus Uhriibacteriota TaxID=1752732 RepID=A0A0G1SEL6_9BACT|nr:MAG: hypothetical protein UX45_C0015G0011 [Candidatus Uhrbacteria bacterium GW2011_GWF2_46_218]KKU40528.1 MAG: hypothetical protein UX57_C0015G0015 [Candidatus Uhrbacteria bacterium GW2011_GWE2_46_68]HBK33619.1 hypothetical protein [Candidatus Uhrbacteria bacterium]HCB19011.1 hypothetical protein [Candidatus Uhrbacteria bacterium]
MHPFLFEAFEFLRLLHDLPASRTHAEFALEETKDGYRLIWFGRRDPDFEKEWISLVTTAGFSVINGERWRNRYVTWQRRGKKEMIPFPLMRIGIPRTFPTSVDWKRIAFLSGIPLDFACHPHLFSLLDHVDLRGVNANTLSPWTVAEKGTKVTADIRGMRPLRSCILAGLDLASSTLDSDQVEQLVVWVERNPHHASMYGQAVLSPLASAEQKARLASLTTL